jgi:glycosyltransferase involved in cell wall biosynthesis
MNLSIVIPVHNGEKFLPHTIRSALSQSRPADEILVVDNDSRDATAEIAKSLEWGSKVKYRFNSTSTGFVDSWNRAIELASGDFITLLHHDDLLYPGYLAKMTMALEKFPGARHLYAACNYIDEYGTVTGGPPEPWCGTPVRYSGTEYAKRYLAGVFSKRHIHRCPGVLTNRALLLDECCYRKEAGHIADDDFFMRVGAFTDVVGISEPLASYRNHSQSETGKADNLTQRLARDYVFQAEYHRRPESLLDKEGLAIIDRLAVHFINLLLFQSLTSDHKDSADEAMQLSTAFRKIAPSAFSCNLPAWARPMWQLIESEKPQINAKIYAKLLRWGNLTMKFLKSSFT